MIIVEKYCRWKADELYVDEQCIAQQGEQEDLLPFLKKMYEKHVGDYAKFHKMDALCKAVFLASELIKTPASSFADDEVAVVLTNASASLTADQAHHSSITSPPFLSSPGQFVYTLPNIMIGEIGIRNKWFGESMFAVFPQFDANFIHDYNTHLLEKNQAQACLTGWVDYQQEKPDILLLLVTKVQESSRKAIPFTPESLNKLYFSERND